MTNGVRIYGNSVSVLDSYFGEIRLIGTGVDAAAISLTIGRRSVCVLEQHDDRDVGELQHRRGPDGDE